MRIQPPQPLLVQKTIPFTFREHPEKMDNQHKFIRGYRDLSEEEVALINDIKAHAEATKNIWEKVNDLTQKASLELVANVGDFISVEMEESLNALDQACDWANEARKDLQTGYMKLIRAVAKPQGF